MNYRNYTTEDFLTDQSFLNYCTAGRKEDIDFWKKWIADNPDKKETTEEALRLFHLLQQDYRDRQQYAAELTNFKSLFNHHTAKRPLGGKIFRLPIRIAAAAACLLLLAVFWFHYQATKEIRYSASKNKQERPKENAVIKKKIVLPDGSIVTLNDRSSLILSKNFNQSERLVYLKGQAFFEVAENKTRPFIVKSGDISTTVLGTSFMIRNYERESSSRVTLLTGKLKVERFIAGIRSPHTIVLTPNQEVVIRKKQDNIPEKHQVEVPDIDNWKQNILSFKDAGLAEMIGQIEDLYGVEIRLRNTPSSAKHFTGEFRDKNLQSVLEALSFSQKFDYIIHNNVVQIQFKENQ